ncbi:MAG: heavy-metal-associated domain-containing protein [Bacteroidales bacterium]|nr:heavy-metal-associated domain-containing protein [Bacteroidales bacterium]
MKTARIIVENLKCHGCAATITRELQKITGVSSVQVNVETSQVEITSDGPEGILNACRSKLLHLGYPEAGHRNTVVLKGKSYVSCAIGRISEKP